MNFFEGNEALKRIQKNKAVIKELLKVRPALKKQVFIFSRGYNIKRSSSKLSKTNQKKLVNVVKDLNILRKEYFKGVGSGSFYRPNTSFVYNSVKDTLELDKTWNYPWEIDIPNRCSSFIDLSINLSEKYIGNTILLGYDSALELDLDDIFFDMGSLSKGGSVYRYIKDNSVEKIIEDYKSDIEKFVLGSEPISIYISVEKDGVSPIIPSKECAVEVQAMQSQLNKGMAEAFINNVFVPSIVYLKKLIDNNKITGKDLEEGAQYRFKLRLEPDIIRVINQDREIASAILYEEDSCQFHVKDLKDSKINIIIGYENMHDYTNFTSFDLSISLS